MATLEQVEEIYYFGGEARQLRQAVLTEVWVNDPAIQEAAMSLIEDIDNLGPVSAREIIFQIYLAILIEELSNGKDIEADQHTGR